MVAPQRAWTEAQKKAAGARAHARKKRLAKTAVFGTSKDRLAVLAAILKRR